MVLQRLAMCENRDKGDLNAATVAGNPWHVGKDEGA
jgi:hypothetical protein